MKGTAAAAGGRAALVRYAAPVLHRIEHEYHGHRVGVVAAGLLGGGRTVAPIAAAVAVHHVRVLLQAAAALVQFDDFAGVDPRVVAQHLCVKNTHCSNGLVNSRNNCTPKSTHTHICLCTCYAH